MLKRIEIKLELFIKNSSVIIDKFGKLLSIFCEKKYFQIHFFICHTNYKNIPKSNWIIHTKPWYSIIINMCFALNYCLLLNFRLLLKPYFVRKTRQGHEFVICTKLQNRVLSWKWHVFIKNELHLPWQVLI